VIRYVVTIVFTGLVLGAISPVILAMYTVVVTVIGGRCLAHRYRPTPYDWPIWVHRARLATLSYLGVQHR